MFVIRNPVAAATSAPTDDELRRQRIVQRVVLGKKYPITLLEKKVAAVVRHKSIDVVLATKILKSLDLVINLFHDESDLYETETRNKILSFLDSIPIENDDVLQLPLKLPIFTERDEFATDIVLTTSSSNNVLPLNAITTTTVNFQMEPISDVNILDFERLCFGSRTLYKYYADTSFALYVYQNLLYSLKISNVSQLLKTSATPEVEEDWRKLFALLLYTTNINESVAYNAFYDNTVVYNNQEYDTSYVPKYDVKKLIPITEIEATSTEQYMINYYYNVDLAKTATIPDHNIGIFLTFPFKQGYYVYPNGTVVYANVPKLRKRSVITSIMSICDISDLEAAVDNVARRVTKEDALSYAVHAKNLIHQAIALLTLRRICGNWVDIPSLSIRINLPIEYDILAWTKISCSRTTRVTLPISFRSPTGDSNVDLVRDIARSCRTKIGACVLCSRYRIPEIDMYYVFSKLTSDAEFYVFYTLILQEYCNFTYYTARDRLNPVFGKDSTVDMEAKYEVAVRRFVNVEVNDRLRSLTEPLVSIQGSVADGGTLYRDCSPFKCPKLYEFRNPQLRELVRDENTTLNEPQLAAFVALCVQQQQ